MKSRNDPLLDLIYGAVGESIDDWAESLEQVIGRQVRAYRQAAGLSVAEVR